MAASHACCSIASLTPSLPHGEGSQSTTRKRSLLVGVAERGSIRLGLSLPDKHRRTRGFLPRPRHRGICCRRTCPAGIRQLTDQEFDRLLAAVLNEQKRRGKKLPVSRKASSKPPVENSALLWLLQKSMPYGLPSRQVSLRHVLPDSLEFPMRTFGRRLQAIRLRVLPMRSRGIGGIGGMG